VYHCACSRGRHHLVATCNNRNERDYVRWFNGYAIRIRGFVRNFQLVRCCQRRIAASFTKQCYFQQLYDTIDQRQHNLLCRVYEWPLYNTAHGRQCHDQFGNKRADGIQQHYLYNGRNVGVGILCFRGYIPLVLCGQRRYVASNKYRS
jgi:hypothetical protein